jgi:putative sterol carrier protein
MRAMTITDLHALLEASFQPGITRGMDAVLRVQAGEAAITFRVDHGTIVFDRSNRMVPDATFHFADIATARGLLQGEQDAFDAFMAGHFRADGYLMWAFALIAMFRGASEHAVPVD